ncbi:MULTISPECIES: acyltransferase family protein [unclassified Pseudomonas]|uniref:acyltransferase family protein n=1 Tax=unclassified Pseudomonas TaxID=196821 RepID=UPI0021BB9E7D|nr:acyltransferase [Pseudomonas sp. HD6422]
MWPLLLIATLRWFGGRFALIIAATGIISFAACQFILSTSQESSFFWMPLRAYEFAVGGFLAAIKLRLTSRLFANILFTLGVMLIAYSFAYFNHSTVFPGWSAMVPCVGTALLILTAPRSSFNNILGSKPLVWLGKRSYSVYLVHWPLIVLYSYYYLEAPSLQHKLFLLITSLVLGYGLFLIVEQPFRKGVVAAKFRSGRTALVSGCTVIAAVVTVSVNAWATDGWP